ncbi:MAG TPA: GtrA family protein [Candidatus Saccharimonadales bacterium]|nr:GtrA family protein [Candidatus Saccharimonadales bacterium]
MYEVALQKIGKVFGERAAAVANQFIKYFGVALVGLVVDFGTLVVLHDVVHAHYLVAAAGGFIAGLAVNYALSSKYVFKNSKLKSRTLEFVMFGVVGLIGLGVLSLSMWLLVSVLGVQYLIAKCLATVGVYIWNFVGRKALYND